jgi:hypothetical protein
MDPDANSETETAEPSSLPDPEKPPVSRAVPVRRTPAPLVPLEKPAPTRVHPGMVAGARLEVQNGVAPFPTLVPTLFLDSGLGRGLWFKLSVGGSYREASGNLGLGVASFLYLGARADLCLCAAAGSWRAGPCLGLESGVVHGGVHDSGRLQNDYSKTLAWVEPMTTFTVAWRPVPWFETNALGGIGFPLRRTEYFFSDFGNIDTVYEVPAVAAVVGLGAGVVFR